MAIAMAATIQAPLKKPTHLPSFFEAIRNSVLNDSLLNMNNERSRLYAE